MKIQEARKKAGLSQSELAKKAGINIRVLQAYEQGQRVFDNAKLETILKCCMALSCKIQDVVENTELIDEYEKSTR